MWISMAQRGRAKLIDFELFSFLQTLKYTTWNQFNLNNLNQFIFYHTNEINNHLIMCRFQHE